MRARLYLLGALLCGAAVVCSTAQALSRAQLQQRLADSMSAISSSSGAYVLDTKSGSALFGSRSSVKRIPASVQKLYTTAASLLLYGESATFETAVYGDGELNPNTGTYRGDLYLVGGGDPSFGSAAFNRRYYGTAASTPDRLAQALTKLGVGKVTGRIYADESLFDRVRGVEDSGWRTSPYVGPLTALTYNRGSNGTSYHGDPALVAAKSLASALKGRKVKLVKGVKVATTPTTAVELVAVSSPTVAELIKLTNHPSDNFFAEMLLKGIGANFGSRGSTRSGAAVVKRTLAKFGIKPKITDGSGLSRSSRTSPKEVTTLLKQMVSDSSFQTFYSALPQAGGQGTLATRMRGSAAEGRCRAKTGTLSNVSALAGYCRAKTGRLIAFAFLMNGVSPYTARPVQDRMAAAIAQYTP